MQRPNLSKTDLHLLHVFVTVTEAGGFSAAQIELNVSPSTVSRQVSDLEIRLGMTLCQRGRAGFRLTEKGALVYTAAQRLFASVQTFGDTVDRSQGRLVGTLSVAAIDNWVFNTGSPFARALRRFSDEAPDVMLELFSLAPDRIERAVQDMRVSIGIGVFHKPKPGLLYETIGSENIGLYCAKGHPLFGQREPARIAALLRSSLYAKRAYLEERDVAPISRQLKTNAEAHQIEGVAHLILTGRYIGFLPEHLAEVWVRDDHMRPVGDGRYVQPSELQLVRKRGGTLTLAAQTFERLVLECARGMH
ncbi:MAG: LysR family transcriptional regulator [Pseudomonadota bacterium]